MDVIECIKKRRSVRSFSEKNISKEFLEELVDCARLAPSARNMQPWEFVVVTSKEKLLEISRTATYGPFIKDASACIVVCGDKENPHLIEDGAAATENILLAATSGGIASCWVAGWKREYNDKIKSSLGIPEKIDIVSIIPLGYSDKKGSDIRKRTLDEVIHWEKY